MPFGSCTRTTLPNIPEDGILQPLRCPIYEYSCLPQRHDRIYTQRLGICNWATLFLGEINTGAWLTRFGEFQNWETKIWLWIPRYSGTRKTALARPSNDWVLEILPTVREGIPTWTNSWLSKNNFKIRRNWLRDSDECLVPRETGRLTVGRDMTLTLKKEYAADPASYPISAAGFSCRLKQPGRDSNHAPELRLLRNIHKASNEM
jgi:hypothetical protein